jgi:hypothetical protein
MLDEIVKKMIPILFSNNKTFLYLQNVKVQTYKESNILMKVFLNTMGRNFLVHVIGKVLFMTKITT